MRGWFCPQLYKPKLVHASVAICASCWPSLTFRGSSSRQEHRKLAKQEMSHIMDTFWLKPSPTHTETAPPTATSTQLPQRAAMPHSGGNRRGRHTSVTTGEEIERFWRQTKINDYKYVKSNKHSIMINIFKEDVLTLSGLKDWWGQTFTC